MKNLYLISSPFQALCATEAKEYFRLNNNIALIVNYANDSSENIQQIQNIIALSQWDEIIIIGAEIKNSKYKEYLKRLFLLKKYIYENIFVGHFGQFQHIILGSLDYKKSFVIDDGVITLDLHKNELNPFRDKKQKILKKLKTLRYRIFGFTPIFDKEKLHYFTIFKLQSYYGEEIIFNKFLFLKKHLENKKQDLDSVYFLGQPLMPDLMSLEDYIKNLMYVQKYFYKRKKKLVYIPHRREKNLEALQSMESEYFSIRKLPNIVELSLLHAEYLPCGIYSFLSTALFSLKAIYSDKIKVGAFKPNSNDFLRNQKKIENIYKELFHNEIELVLIEK